jgi:hypothetical protein
MHDCTRPASFSSFFDGPARTLAFPYHRRAVRRYVGREILRPSWPFSLVVNLANCVCVCAHCVCGAPGRPDNHVSPMCLIRVCLETSRNGQKKGTSGVKEGGFARARRRGGGQKQKWHKSGWTNDRVVVWWRRGVAGSQRQMKHGWVYLRFTSYHSCLSLFFFHAEGPPCCLLLPPEPLFSVFPPLLPTVC